MNTVLNFNWESKRQLNLGILGGLTGNFIGQYSLETWEQKIFFLFIPPA